jgi:hypothetical protein
VNETYFGAEKFELSEFQEKGQRLLIGEAIKVDLLTKWDTRLCLAMRLES